MTDAVYKDSEEINVTDMQNMGMQVCDTKKRRKQENDAKRNTT